MKNIILSFICLIAFVSSCSKYDDGPAFSLLTKTQRVTGTWDLKQVIVNGEVMTPNDTYTNTYDTYCWNTGMSYSYDLISSNSHETTWEFDKDGDFSRLDYYTSNYQTLDSFSCVNFQAYISNNTTNSTNSTNSTYADWEFSSDKLELEIDYGGTSQDFEITRLTNKEMTLDQKYEGIKTEYQFEKQ